MVGGAAIRWPAAAPASPHDPAPPSAPACGAHLPRKSGARSPARPGAPLWQHPSPPSAWRRTLRATVRPAGRLSRPARSVLLTVVARHGPACRARRPAARRSPGSNTPRRRTASAGNARPGVPPARHDPGAGTARWRPAPTPSVAVHCRSAARECHLGNCRSQCCHAWVLPLRSVDRGHRYGRAAENPPPDRSRFHRRSVHKRGAPISARWQQHGALLPAACGTR